MINTNVNADLALYGVHDTFPNKSLTLDVALLATPEISAKGYVAAKINGTFFDPNSSAAIPYTAVPIPDRDDAGKDFQFFVTDYHVNTFLFARYQAKQNVDISSYLNMLGVTITTDDIGAAIP